MYLASLARSQLRSGRTATLAQPCYRRWYDAGMADADANANGSGGPAGQKAKDDSTREVKILMLHGYTQSGPLFRSKTRALEKLLTKSLAPLRLRPTLLYPTAPNRLSVRDIPGYQQPPSGNEADEAEGEGEDTSDAWAWWRRDEATGQYRLVREGMTALAACVRDAGGVDGVVGFSQGGALAAMLASALEHVPTTSSSPDDDDEKGGQKQHTMTRQRRPTTAPAAAQDQQQHDDDDWLQPLRDANGGRPLKFAVVYSGFFAPDAAGLSWLYEPKVRTPTLHFIGSLDTVVEEDRSRGLVARCEDPVVVVHPGGHYVPVSKEWVNPLVGFVRQWCVDDADEDEE